MESIPGATLIVIGSLDGETFWVGCGWFSLGDLGEDEGGEEINTRARTAESFHLTTRVFKQPHFYVIYYIVSTGGFAASCFKTIGNGVPDPRCPGQTRTATVEVSTTLIR